MDTHSITQLLRDAEQLFYSHSELDISSVVIREFRDSPVMTIEVPYGQFGPLCFKHTGGQNFTASEYAGSVYLRFAYQRDPRIDISCKLVFDKERVKQFSPDEIAKMVLGNILTDRKQEQPPAKYRTSSHRIHKPVNRFDSASLGLPPDCDEDVFDGESHDSYS